MLLFSGLSWNPVPAAYLTVKPRLLVLLSSRVVTNQSFLYKNALSYCSPCYFSASHGNVYLYSSYPATPLNRTVFRKTYLSPNYRLNRLPPVPLSSWVVINISILYKNALFYCTPCYFSPSHSYVYIYNSYPVPTLNWNFFRKTYLTLNYRPDRLQPVPLSSRVVTNKSILYKNALFYCSPCYFSASHDYVHLYNSYPDPPLNWTIFINLSVASVYFTSVYVSASHSHVNKAIRYKNALFYCTPCYFSASHGYVYLYNSYPVSPLNWTIFIKINLSVAFVYYTPVYFSASHSHVNLHNSYPVPPLNWTFLKKIKPSVLYITFITC